MRWSSHYWAEQALWVDLARLGTVVGAFYPGYLIRLIEYAGFVSGYSNDRERRYHAHRDSGAAFCFGSQKNIRFNKEQRRMESTCIEVHLDSL